MIIEAQETYRNEPALATLPCRRGQDSLTAMNLARTPATPTPYTPRAYASTCAAAPIGDSPPVRWRPPLVLFSPYLDYIEVGILQALLLILALLLVSVTAKIPQEKPSANVLSWFKLSPAQFGCYLEKKYNEANEWGCGLIPEHNLALMQAHRQGPGFPRSLSKRLHHSLQSVSLHWENGRLQSISLDFDQSISEKNARALFGILESTALRGPLSASFQKRSSPGSSLILLFNHQLNNPISPMETQTFAP